MLKINSKKKCSKVCGALRWSARAFQLLHVTNLGPVTTIKTTEQQLEKDHSYTIFFIQGAVNHLGHVRV